MGAPRGNADAMFDNATKRFPPVLAGRLAVVLGGSAITDWAEITIGIANKMTAETRRRIRMCNESSFITRENYINRSLGF